MKYSKSLIPSIISWLILVILSLIIILCTKFGVFFTGIIVGLIAGLVDILASTFFLLRSLKSKLSSSIQVFMTAGLFFRMVVIIGLGLFLNAIVPDAGYAFAITFLISHFGHIGAIFWIVNKFTNLKKNNLIQTESPNPEPEK